MSTTTYSMNPVALVFFVLVILGGTVSLWMDVLRGKRSFINITFATLISILGIADLLTVFFGGVNSSLSAWIVSHGGIDYTGFWKFAIGNVTGHLFFPMREIKSAAK